MLAELNFLVISLFNGCLNVISATYDPDATPAHPEEDSVTAAQVIDEPFVLSLLELSTTFSIMGVNPSEVRLINDTVSNGLIILFEKTL